jgi:uncharacterized membrane protein
MVLIGRALVALLLLWAAAPGAAHKDHGKKAAAEKQVVVPAPAATPVTHPMSPTVHEATKHDLARLEAEAAKPWPARLLDWIGRIHPFAVHFPLALFPVAWVALLLARRRRGRPDDTVRALIVVAGTAGAGAALLGWINGGWSLSDPDPILRAHRWLGTLLGLAGGGAAAWVWRRSAAADTHAMIWLVGALTLALLVQGWLGGALIHGIDHLAM